MSDTMSLLYRLVQTVLLRQMVQLPMATNRDPVVHLDIGIRSSLEQQP